MIHKFTLLENILLRFNVIPHPVLDALNYVVAGRGLQVSLKIGVFDALNKGALNIDQIAKSTNSSTLGIAPLLDVLTAFDYVKELEEGNFTLTNRGKRFFSKDSNSSLRNTVLFSDYVFNSLQDLEENVRRGDPKNVNLEIFSQEQWDIFNNTMVEVARSNAPEIANKLPLINEYKKLLDIGGSHGLHAIEICKKIPGLSAEILDLEPVKKVAESTIKQNKMTSRIKFRIGDMLNDNLGENYDIILAFNIIHGFKPEVNRRLVKRVFKALNPGGIFVILDQVKDAQGKSELSKLVSSSMGLMLFNVAGGKTYTLSEIEKWLSGSGFKKVKMKKLRAPGNALVLGHK